MFSTSKLPQSNQLNFGCRLIYIKKGEPELISCGCKATGWVMILQIGYGKTVIDLRYSHCSFIKLKRKENETLPTDS